MANQKQIKEFNELLNPLEDDEILIQEKISGITKKVKTKNLLGQDSRNLMEHATSTTIVSGGGLALNGTNFDVTAGIGEFVDYWTDPEHPAFTHVEWSTQTNITPISGAIAITIYIDKDGVVQQSAGTDVNNVINAGQLGIVLGAIQTDGAGNALLATDGTTNYGQTPGRTVSELALAIGPQRISGLNIVSNGANLKMNQDGGVFYQHGGFWFEDKQNTSKKTFTADTAFTPLGIYQDGSGGFTIALMNQTGTSNDLDVGSLDDGSGTLTTYSSGSYGLFEVYQNVTGTKFIIYPQKAYISIDKAKQGIELDERVVPADVGTALLLGWVIAKGNATDLSNTSQALILNSKGAFTGSVGAGANSLQQAYDVSNDPEITIKDIAGGCFSIKDSATDATKGSGIFEVKDSSDNIVLGVNNDGVATNAEALITANTYTPVGFPGSGASPSAFYTCSFIRVGNILQVTVNGSVNISSTSGSWWEISIPLSVGLSLSNTFGSGTYHDGTSAEGENILVYGSSTTGRVRCKIRSGITGTEDYSITFQYSL